MKDEYRELFIDMIVRGNQRDATLRYINMYGVDLCREIITFFDYEDIEFVVDEYTYAQGLVEILDSINKKTEKRIKELQGNTNLARKQRESLVNQIKSEHNKRLKKYRKALDTVNGGREKAYSDNTYDEHRHSRFYSEAEVKQAIGLIKRYSYNEEKAYSYADTLKRIIEEGIREENAKYALMNCDINWADNAVKLASKCINDGWSKGYSYVSLIETLVTRYNFNRIDAEAGAFGVSKNWNKEVLKVMDDYIGYMSAGYSPVWLSTVLIQRTYFTEEQAEYAMSKCSVNWDDMAYSAAKWYLKDGGIRADEVIDMLLAEHFTLKQAEFGLKAALSENLSADEVDYDKYNNLPVDNSAAYKNEEGYEETYSRIIFRGYTKKRAEKAIKVWGCVLCNALIDFIEYPKDENNRVYFKDMQIMLKKLYVIVDLLDKRIAYWENSTEYSQEEKNDALKDVRASYRKVTSFMKNCEKNVQAMENVEIVEAEAVKTKKLPYEFEKGYDNFLENLCEQGYTEEDAQNYIKLYGVEGGRKINSYIRMKEDINEASDIKSIEKLHRAVSDAIKYVKKKVNYWKETNEYPDDERKSALEEVKNMQTTLTQEQKYLADILKSRKEAKNTDKNNKSDKGNDTNEKDLGKVVLSYLSDSHTGYSLKSLKSKLKRYENLYDADATELIKQLNIDFKEQAYKCASWHFKLSGADYDELKDILQDAGFTPSEAEFGANKVFESSAKSEYNLDKVNDYEFEVSDKNKISYPLVAAMVIIRLLMLL